MQRTGAPREGSSFRLTSLQRDCRHIDQGPITSDFEAGLSERWPFAAQWAALKAPGPGSEKGRPT